MNNVAHNRALVNADHLDKLLELIGVLFGTAIVITILICIGLWLFFRNK